MILGFITMKTVYLIAHVFGAILGAGGAFSSDAMFFNSIKDGVIDKKEIEFMKLGGKVVWLGVAILVISGALLFFTDPDKYMNSSKFLVKVIIVAIIIINGIIFHRIHMPHMHGHTDIKLVESESFMKKINIILISGAVSMTSWIATVILGMLRDVPYSFTQIMSVYLAMVLIAITSAMVMKKIVISRYR